MVQDLAQTVQEMAVRERLLAAATEIFAQKGYTAAKVREIVAAAGVTKPALYYYFQNKEGLYLALMREGLEKLDDLLDTSRAAIGGTSDKILALCDRLLVLLAENMQLARVIYAVHYGPPQGSPPFDCNVFHLKFREAVHGLVSDGIAGGEFQGDNAMDMAWAVLGAVNITIEVELCHPELSLGREGLARVLGLILKGLRSENLM